MGKLLTRKFRKDKVETLLASKGGKLLTGNGGKVVDRKGWKGCWREKVGKLLAGKGRKVVLYSNLYFLFCIVKCVAQIPVMICI